MGRPISKKFFGPVVPNGTQLAAQAWLDGDTQPRVGYIVKQNGSNRYHVMTSFGEGECQLVDVIGQPGQMTIQVVAEGTPGIQSAQKITDREVYTWTNNNYYPYWEPINGQIVYGNGTAHQYWFASYGDVTADTAEDYSEGVTFDNQGNMYICGAKDVVTLSAAYVTKLGPSANIVWQKTFTDGGNETSAECIMADSVGNVYVAIVTHDTSYNGSTIIAKLNSDGDIVWQRKLENFGYPFDIAVNSDGSVAFASDIDSSQINVAKYNSGGVIQWQKTIGNGTSESLDNPGIGFTTAGKLAVSSRFAGISDLNISLLSLNTDGTIGWSNTIIVPANTNIVATALDTDSTGNIYVQSFAQDISTSRYKGIISKYLPDGTQVWQRIRTSLPTDLYAPFSIKSDADGNTYSAGYGYDSNVMVFGLTLTKHDSDGNLDWQRLISSTTDVNIHYNYGNRDVAVYGSQVVVAGYVYSTPSSNYYDALIANLPTDGSKTGLYGVFSYIQSTFPADSAVWSTGTHSMTIANAGLTESAAALAVSDFTYEIQFTDLV